MLKELIFRNKISLSIALFVSASDVSLIEKVRIFALGSNFPVPLRIAELNGLRADHIRSHAHVRMRSHVGRAIPKSGAIRELHLALNFPGGKTIKSTIISITSKDDLRLRLNGYSAKKIRKWKGCNDTPGGIRVVEWCSESSRCKPPDWS